MQVSLIKNLSLVPFMRCLQEYIGNYRPSEAGQLEFAEGVLVKAVRNGDWSKFIKQRHVKRSCGNSLGGFSLFTFAISNDLEHRIIYFKRVFYLSRNSKSTDTNCCIGKFRTTNIWTKKVVRFSFH